MSEYVPASLHLYLLPLLLLFHIFQVVVVLCHEARRQGERDLTGPVTQRNVVIETSAVFKFQVQLL